MIETMHKYHNFDQNPGKNHTGVEQAEQAYPAGAVCGG